MSTSPHSEEDFPPNPLLFLADTDRTQAYVFESARLPEIRGASHILDEANRQAGERVRRAGGQVIVQAGGMLVAFVPDEDTAQRLKQDIECDYADLSGGVATVTVAWRPLPPGWQRRPFGQILAWANRWLQREKRSRAYAPWFAAPPHAERCRSCGLRPASPEASYPDHPLCLPCRHKIQHQRRRALWFDAFRRWLAPKKGQPFAAPWQDFLAAGATSPMLPIPQDISELAQTSAHKPGTFALLYLDGDGLGGVFRALKTPEEVRALSTCLEQVMREAVFHHLAQHLRPTSVAPSESRREVGQWPPQEVLDAQGALKIFPFEILTIGGDDIWLLVPSHRALDLAVDIAEAFQQGTQRCAAGRTLTMSGGVVLAESHVPLPMLFEMAKTLAASAKAQRRLARAAEGYVDFWVVTTDLPDRDLRAARRLFPYRLPTAGDAHRPEGEGVRLSARPYPLSRWHQGLAALRRVALPTSQLQGLATVLPQGVEALRAFFHYQRSRNQKSRALWAPFEEALRTLAGMPDTPIAHYPWFAYQRAGATRPWTPLVDILELLPFLDRPQGSEDE